MSEQKHALADLAGQKQRVLHLAALQIELRTAVAAMMKKQGLTVNTLSKRLDIGHGEIQRFLKMKQVVCTGRILEALTASVDRNDLQKKILNATDGLWDSTAGLALFTSGIIKIVFLLEERFVETRDINRATLATLFGERATLVLGLIKHNQEVISAFSADTTSVQAILDVLNNKTGWQRSVLALREQKEHEKNARIERTRVLVERLKPYCNNQVSGVAQRLDMNATKVHHLLRGDKVSVESYNAFFAKTEETLKELEKPTQPPLADQTQIERTRVLVEALAARYPSQSALAEALGTYPRRLREYLAGKAKGAPIPEAAYAKLFARAERLMREPEVTPAPTVEPAAVPPQTKPVTVSTPLTLVELIERGAGGGTSPLGVSFSLTGEAFREIEGDPGSDYVQTAKRAIRWARILLNIGAQLKDQKIRERIQRELNADLEELEMTVKTFSFEFPNRLTPNYDAQRRTWAHDEQQANGATTTKRKGGRP